MPARPPLLGHHGPGPDTVGHRSGRLGMLGAATAPDTSGGLVGGSTRESSDGEPGALLIGSQTGGLTGVHGDVEVMADALSSLGFEVRPHIEQAATSVALIDAYRALVADTASADAAVVFYSGHRPERVR